MISEAKQKELKEKGEEFLETTNKFADQKEAWLKLLGSVKAKDRAELVDNNQEMRDLDDKLIKAGERIGL